MILDQGAPVDFAALRCEKGISLKDISETTKIGITYLQAIEEGNFAVLPPGIYARSFVQQYARAIDYDESEILEWYNRKMGVVPEVSEAPSRKRSFFNLLQNPSLLNFIFRKT
ncbi:MAG TPA: helix-turn-helix transcriptional regulator [Bryobacteraceae bacterium]|nr:helix-turn-helix transcriptional regulator [Bryobacteraceae bacterium]HOQ44679.1 helix-turn-helix transcriptional regulator [Bryobacteraceae bacterium]HPQ15826.1 helix-turn-helix transcriptional regulator [Bryobacteraceae bacterium]HPU71889.1 helix-turn-helix transcriptional regulator [Bryobacteraceae bacterium]